jgi:hypothetical protein
MMHMQKYWSYYMHILPDNNLNCFPAITEENIQDFIERLNIIHQEVLTIVKFHLKQQLLKHSIKVDTQTEVSQ